MKPWLRIVFWITGLGLALLLLIQFIPYGRHLANPPVIAEPNWDSLATRTLFKNACFDCHSNETQWPWYARVAPASWLLQYDIDKARSEINFSEWQTGMGPEAIVEVIEGQEMPPWRYWIIHPEARLTPAQRQQMVEAIRATLK